MDSLHKPYAFMRHMLPWRWLAGSIPTAPHKWWKIGCVPTRHWSWSGWGRPSHGSLMSLSTRYNIRHKADGKESGCRNFVQLSTEDVHRRNDVVHGSFQVGSDRYIYNLEKHQRFGTVFTWQKSGAKLPNWKDESQLGMDGAFLLDKMPRFPGRKVEVEAGDAVEKVPVPSGNVARNCFLGGWSWENAIHSEDIWCCLAAWNWGFKERVGILICHGLNDS